MLFDERSDGTGGNMFAWQATLNGSFRAIV